MEKVAVFNRIFVGVFFVVWVTYNKINIKSLSEQLKKFSSVCALLFTGACAG